jgi:CSLREA domain-containing protein
MKIRRTLLGALAATACAVAGTQTAVAAQPAVTLTGPAKAKVGKRLRFTIAVDGVRLAAFEARVLVNGRAVELAGAGVRTANGARPLGPTQRGQSLHLGFYGARPAGASSRVAGFAYRAMRAGRITVRVADVVAVDARGRRIALAGASRAVAVGRASAVWRAPSAGGTAARRARAVDADLTGEGRIDSADVGEAIYAVNAARERGATCDLRGAYGDANRDGCVDVADIQLVRAQRSAAQAPRVDRARAAQVAGARAFVAPRPGEGVYVVTTTSDDDDAAPGDGVCATAAGRCSFRAALDEANRHRGVDHVHFDIPGPGPHTIRVLRNMIHVTDRTGGVVIDGYTQTGAAENTDPLISNARIMVQLQGPMPNAAGTTIARVSGPYFTSANNTMRGLAIFGFHRTMWLAGAQARGNRIVGNFIGLGATPANWTPAPKPLYTNGGLMIDAASDNIIGTPALEDRNVISGNYGSGVYLTHTGSDRNVIQNNIVGLSPTADRGVENHSHGVDLNFGSKSNVIGGFALRERNVIAGNDETGIELSHGYNSALPANQDHSEPFVLRANRILGNYVGFMPDGTLSPISKNHGDARQEGAIHMEDWIYDTEIRGNWFTHDTGPSIVMQNGAIDNLVTENHFGVGPDGAPAPGAGTGWAVSLREGSSGNAIVANEMANLPGGVWITGSSAGNRISRNAMRNLGGLGIDLNLDGVSTGGRSQSGPNRMQPMPAIDAATTAVVSGTTESCGSCTVEVFVASGAAGGYGPGGTYLGSAPANVTGAWSVAIPAGALAGGDLVTATATDAGGNTSEFARSVVAGEAPPPPAPDEPLAEDGFARTLASGWGAAPTGGGYRLRSALADYAVNGAVGTMRLGAGVTREAWLAGVSALDTNAVARISLDGAPAGGSAFAYLTARRSAAGNAYRAKLRFAPNGAVFAQATRVVGGAETGVGAEIQLDGLTHTAGAAYRVRMQVTGASPTTIRVTVWRDGDAEPAAPQLVRSDGEPALQAAGAPGMAAYLGGAATNAPLTVGFDDWSVRAG